MIIMTENINDSQELQGYKDYLRVQHNIDDSYIQSLISMSKSFIYEQTGVEYSATDKVYHQFEKLQ